MIFEYSLTMIFFDTTDKNLTSNQSLLCEMNIYNDNFTGYSVRNNVMSNLNIFDNNERVFLLKF